MCKNDFPAVCVVYVYLKLAKIVLRQESKAKQSKMWVKAVASVHQI